MTETGLRLKRIKDKAEGKLREKYGESIYIAGREAFRTGSGYLVSLARLPSLKAIVAEYAESVEAAERYEWEDGDLFYLEEDDETIIAGILKEIEE